MKFPLPTPAFPPVELSVAERAAFEALAERKLNEALAAFDAFNSADAQEVNRARWKPVKTREGVTVFRERLPRRKKRQQGGEEPAWRLPRLLGVGTLLGTLDDVMYGTMSPTAAAVMVKADYCEDEVVDAQVLHEMRGPTLARPFQFLGLKWLVKRHPVGLDAVVLPRDLVYLETTGIVDRTDGSRVGHFLIHSVDLPERCGCLRRDLGIVRSRISSCFLFRERALSGGGGPRVDVFMTGQVEPNGRVMDRAALVSAASGLMCFGRAVVCAQHRKLSWRLRTAATQRQLAHDKESSKIEAVPHHCSVCARAFGTFAGLASSSACAMCGSRALCSRCMVTKTLSFVGGGNDRVTHRVPVTFCRPCVLVTSRADAATIAREEIRAGEFGSLTSPRSACADGSVSAKKTVADVEREDAQLSSRSTELSLAYLDDLFLAADPLGSEADDDDDDWKALLLDDADELTSGSSGEFSSSLSSEASGRASESLLAASSSSASTVLSASTRDQQQQQMWAQISVLRRVAEATYHFAKENTEQTLLMSSGGPGSGRKSLESLLPHKTLVP